MIVPQEHNTMGNLQEHYGLVEEQKNKPKFSIMSFSLITYEAYQKLMQFVILSETLCLTTHKTFNKHTRDITLSTLNTYYLTWHDTLFMLFNFSIVTEVFYSI